MFILRNCAAPSLCAAPKRLKRRSVSLAVLTVLALAGCSEETEDKDNEQNKTSSVVVTPELSIEGEKTITEPADGESEFTIKLTLSAVAAEDISVDYTIDAITAEAGKDFIAASDGTIEIKVGARTAEIPYTIRGDVLDEDDETLAIRLTRVSGANIRSNSGLITIKDEDPDSEVAFNTDFARVAEGSGLYSVKVRLTTASEKEVQIPFTLSGLATQGQDYLPSTVSPITVPAGAQEVDIALDFISDTIPEGGESVVVQLQTPKNAVLGERSKITLMIPGDVGLNDTGITTWYDGTSYDSTAPDSAYPGQDASYGRDAAGEPDFDGHAGFTFTKLDLAGNALPSDAQTYRCVLDNRTGLIWERKSVPQELPTQTGEALRKHLESVLSGNAYPYHAQNANWRAANYRYFWYDANNASNGGAPGAQGEIFTNMRYPISNICAFPNKESISYSPLFNRCDTTVYAKAMNDLAVCGFKDWRLPRISELSQIHNFSAQPNRAGHDNYFPNTADGNYLSATPSADGTGAVWCAASQTGQVRLCNKQHLNYVRMVRGGAQ